MSKYNLMLAHPYDPDRIKHWRWMSIEPKMDGVRVVVEVRDGRVVFKSRNGRQLYMFDHLRKLFLKLAGGLKVFNSEYRLGVVFDGEMLGKEFARIAGDIHRKNYTAKDARFLCFHVMPTCAFKDRADTKPQAVRLRHLNTAFEDTFTNESRFIIVKPRAVDSHRKVLRIHKRLRKSRLHGLKIEGAMVKDYSQPWIGKRTHAWMKMKDCKSVDLRVVGIKEGKKGGKWEGKCGSLIVVYKGVKVPVSGMTDALRKRARKLVGRMIEVSYQEVTKAGSLRHPRFVRLRDDKDDKLKKVA